LAHEVNNLKHDLQLNGFPPELINSVINNIGGNNRLRNDVKPIGSVVNPYVKGISDEFKRFGKRYNIRTIFKTKYTFRNTLVITRSMIDPSAQHNAFTICLANAVEAMNAKQAERYP
jgi:hypothetical protein